MTRRFPLALALLSFAAAMIPSAGQAQWYSSRQQQPAPLYPYAMPNNQPYAVQISPNAYVIHRPDVAQSRASARTRTRSARQKAAAEKKAAAVKKPVIRNDRALIEELRERHKSGGKKPNAVNTNGKKTTVINTKRIVRGKPIVIETKRYVDEPTRVIERYRMSEEPAPQQQQAMPEPPVVAERPAASRPSARTVSKPPRQAKAGPNAKPGDVRVIDAEAEITILGPDRMNIRLFRKGDAKASAD